MSIWKKIFSLLAVLVAVATISACGNRGPLYLEHADENESQPGHDLTQDADKENEKKASTVKKDKQE